MTVNAQDMPNGTILIFHIRYENQAQRNPEAAQVYTYVMSKASNLWYTSGAGQVPQAAGWGAVEKWLARDGRQVVKVERVIEQVQMWPIVAAVGSPLQRLVQAQIDRIQHSGVGLPCKTCDGRCTVDDGLGEPVLEIEDIDHAWTD